jgi:hypothetical protein
MSKDKSRPNIPDPADIFVGTTETLVTGLERLSRRESLLARGKSGLRIRSAVKRSRAGEYLFLLLLGFAGSVALTRIFLELAGYPQIGNAELHIAHVLWGGLLVFVASLLPLILGNPWVFPVSAFLSGIGMGLFIDEVGKFITQSNDYFFPAAAPIIYIVFLLTAWLYLRIRKPASRDPRAVAYRVLEGISEVLDRDLDERERAYLLEQVSFIEQATEQSDLTRLAEKLKEFLYDERLEVIGPVTTWLDRWRVKRNDFLDRYVPEPIHRLVAALGLVILGFYALRLPIRLLFVRDQPEELGRFVLSLLDRGMVQVTSSASVFTTWLGLEAGIGLALAAAVILLLFVEDRGIFMGQRSLVAYIAVVNIFVFYFHQFSIIPFVLFQFFMLWVLKSYRLRGFASEQKG